MNFQTGQKYKIYFQLVNVVLARPNTLLLTYLVLIVSKAHKPFTEDLHYCLSADICCTMPQGHPWSFIFSTDVRRVSLADLFFPGGVYLKLSLVFLMFPFSEHCQSTSTSFFYQVRYGSCLSCLVQLFVADLVWPEYLEDPMEASCLKGV